jgi:hypothetical protein
LELLKSEISDNPNIGKDIGNGIHKIRLNIRSKGKGKTTYYHRPAVDEKTRYQKGQRAFSLLIKKIENQD